MSTGLGFPTTLAAKLTGVTPKTLENWAQRGFLKPSIVDKPGYAGTRIYSFRDLIVIRVVDDMRQKGIDVRHLRRVVDYLRKRLVTSLDVPTTVALVSDGHKLYEVDINEEARVSPLLSADESVLVVPLGRFVAKIQAEAQKSVLVAA